MKNKSENMVTDYTKLPKTLLNTGMTKGLLAKFADIKNSWKVYGISIFTTLKMAT
jgi:hypothetical protein